MSKVCQECGAVIKKPKKHQRWHRDRQYIPGPPGPAGIMGPKGDPGESSLGHNPIDTIISMLRDQAKK